MSTTTSEQERVVVIRPPTRWAVLNLKEVWQYRDLLRSLATRDVKLRYRQTALGIIWVILQPLIAAAILSFVFGVVAKIEVPIQPYFLYAYAGMLAWNLFGSVLTRTSTCLVQNSQLVSKVYFPRLVLPLSTIFSSLIDFAVAFAVLLILLPIYHISPGLNILLLPVWTLVLLVTAVGIGLYASALMVSFRDVQFVLPVLIQLGMYGTAVVYPVPDKYRFLFGLNPLNGILDAFRWSVLGVGKLELWPLLYAAIFAAVVFIGATFEFKRLEKRFADVI